MEPRRPFLTISPTVWVEEGSPTRHQVIFSLRASSVSATAGGAVDKGTLFIAGDQKGDGALMIRIGADKTLHGHQHGSQGSLSYRRRRIVKHPFHALWG